MDRKRSVTIKDVLYAFSFRLLVKKNASADGNRLRHGNTLSEPNQISSASMAAMHLMRATSLHSEFLVHFVVITWVVENNFQNRLLSMHHELITK